MKTCRLAFGQGGAREQGGGDLLGVVGLGPGERYRL
jgi:hypothetical protein